MTPTLHAYDTGEELRDATPAELAESVEAARHDGGAGVIEVNGVRCYVDGPAPLISWRELQLWDLVGDRRDRAEWDTSVRAYAAEPGLARHPQPGEVREIARDGEHDYR